jgi:UDP-sulfoquinovose synthase
MSNILVAGGDGFIGWPTSLQLAKDGHRVVIVDNFMRRSIDLELGANSVVPIFLMRDRLETANSIFDGRISYYHLDIVVDFEEFKKLLVKEKIDIIIHLAEIKSAPYSMLNSKKSRQTVNNNINATHNILAAIVDVNTEISLVHIGTMGVYGYSDVFGEIPEGYLDITVNQTGEKTKILFPTNPGSIYHMTKSLDQTLFAFYNKVWGLKITDLHQGIVWGSKTDLTSLDEKLGNRFDYDGEYGTVLNRFIVEAAAGIPLTVYGTGGQTRAFINIQDSVRCLSLAVENNDFDNSGVRIFNQVSETKSVIELANIISQESGVPINRIENPRKEAAENKLSVKNDGLKSLGFEPIMLSNDLINDVIYLASKYSDRVDRSVIDSKAVWS